MPSSAQQSKTSRASEAAMSSPRTAALRGLRPTPVALAFVAINATIAIAAMNSEANLLFLIACMCVGMLAVSAVLPVLQVRRAEAERILPQGVVAGRPFSMGYVVRNGRRWGSCWSLTIGESPADAWATVLPRAFVARLRPHAIQKLELLGCCQQRGRLNLTGIRITSRFPVGLFSCSVDLRRPDELVVFPAVGRLRADLVRGAGISAVNTEKRGKGRRGEEEFAGVREFRDGDNYHWIHWRRSARTGELVVREYLPYQANQLIILLDAWPEVTDGRGSASRPRVGEAPHRPGMDESAERVISAAATAICDALDRGHRVGLIARGASPVVLAPAGGRPQRQRLLHELAVLAPGSAEGLDQLVTRIRWTGGWHARCLLFTPRHAKEHRRALRVVSRRAETVMTVIPGTEWFNSVFGPAPDRGSERRAR